MCVPKGRRGQGLIALIYCCAPKRSTCSVKTSAGRKCRAKVTFGRSRLQRFWRAHASTPASVYRAFGFRPFSIRRRTADGNVRARTTVGFAADSSGSCPGRVRVVSQAGMSFSRRRDRNGRQRPLKIGPRWVVCQVVSGLISGWRVDHWMRPPIVPCRDEFRYVLFGSWVECVVGAL